VTEWLNNAIQVGSAARKARQEYGSDDAFYAAWCCGDIAGLPEFGDLPMTDSDWQAAYQVGYAGCDSLPKVRGWRYGHLPASGRSYNHRDEHVERGVSLMALETGEETQDAISAVFIAQGREQVWVEGYLLPWRGSDGEPLVIDAREIDAPAGA
jgi:hypothetical protein